MNTFSHKMRLCCVRAVALKLALLVTAAPAEDGWRIPAADARVPLCIEGDLFARREAKFEAVIDFNALLGMRRVLAGGSLSLVGSAKGEPFPLELAQDAEIRYASGNPILRLRWSAGLLARFERLDWHLYLRTVAPRSENAWTDPESTFVPTREQVLFQSGFEAPDPQRPDRPEYLHPGGWDKGSETSDRVWTDEEAHRGRRALKIARTVEGEPPRNSNRPFWWTWPPPMPVLPGQGVRVSAWLKAPRLEKGSHAAVALEFRGQDRRRIHGGRLRLAGKRFPHDWLKVSGSTTAPPGAATAVFWFTLHRWGQAYCDDVTVTTIPGGDLPKLDVAVGPIEHRAAFVAGQQERPEGKVLACTAALHPPALDGALDDPCWQNAGRIDDLETHAQILGTKVATTVRACADREALYFAFECAEPATAALRANATERDGRLWEDDSVELFLDTNLDLHTYYQIIVNPRGAIFDQDKGAKGLAGAKWDGPVTAAARVLPDRWCAEVRLGFDGLRLAEAEGRVWGANFARSSFRRGRSLYVWAPVKKNFGEPQHFGRLVLPFDPTANVVTGKPLSGSTVFWGEGALPFEVANRREHPVAVRVSATEEADKGDRPLGVATATVQGRAQAAVRVPATFPKPGEVRVRYELFEAETGKLLYHTSVTHAVPAPLAIEPAALVSYVAEDRVRGVWTIGLADAAVGEARLALAVSPVNGGKPLATAEVAPAGTTGTYAVHVADLPAGRYRLRARLLRKGEKLDEASYGFDCVPGPFSPTSSR